MVMGGRRGEKGWGKMLTGKENGDGNGAFAAGEETESWREREG